MEFWFWWGGTGIVFAIASCRMFAGPMSIMDVLVCIPLGIVGGPIVWAVHGFGWWPRLRPGGGAPEWLTRARF